MKPAFAIWVTGLPASGKSTLTAALVRRLARDNVEVAVLESDEARKVITPKATYAAEERDVFYRSLVYAAGQLTAHGIPVIIDATGNRRWYRDFAREGIPRFVEVYVQCPPEVCIARDPKGIYRAFGSSAGTVPGVQAPYELPLTPDLTVAGDAESPDDAAGRVFDLLRRRGYLPEPDQKKDERPASRTES